MAQSTHHRHYQSLLDVLRRGRRSADLTQAALGERLGNTQTFVSKVERGERRLDVVEFTEWCEALGVSAEETFSEFLALRLPMRTARGQKIAAKKRR